MTREDGDAMIFSEGEGEDGDSLDTFLESLAYIDGGDDDDDDDHDDDDDAEEGGTGEHDDDEEEEDDGVPRRGRKKGSGVGQRMIQWKDEGELIGTVHPNTKVATKVFRESLGYSIKYVGNNCERTVYGCTAHVDCPVLIAQYKHGTSAQFWQVICVGAPPPKPPPTLHPARLQTSMHGRDPSSL